MSVNEKHTYHAAQEAMIKTATDEGMLLLIGFFIKREGVGSRVYILSNCELLDDAREKGVIGKVFEQIRELLSREEKSGMQ